MGIAVTAVVALASWARRSRDGLARRHGLDGIDDMTGEEFEDWLARRFRRAGWRVRHTAQSGDFGADLLIERDGEEWVVQAKRQARPVAERHSLALALELAGGRGRAAQPELG